jgi:hypothetical protein
MAPLFRSVIELRLHKTYKVSNGGVCRYFHGAGRLEWRRPLCKHVLRIGTDYGSTECSSRGSTRSFYRREINASGTSDKGADKRVEEGTLEIRGGERRIVLTNMRCIGAK